MPSRPRTSSISGTATTIARIAHEPAQRLHASFVHVLLPGGASADNQSVSQLGVVISQPLFKPGPAGFGDFIEDRPEPLSQLFADIVGQPGPAVTLHLAQIFVNANQAEGPSARRSEIGHGRQRLREELFGHRLRTPMRRAPNNSS